jgi:hypothetical protein
LKEQFSKSNVAAELRLSIDTLLRVLGTSIEEVQPDLLRLASRSIAANARAYAHPQAEWELLPDTVAKIFELSDVLNDLQNFAGGDIDAYERAIQSLGISIHQVSRIRENLDALADLAGAFDGAVTDRAADSLQIGQAAEKSARSDSVRIAIVGGRLLISSNFASAVARALTGRKLPDRSSRSSKVGASASNQMAQNNGAESGLFEEILQRTKERIRKELPKKMADAVVDVISSSVRHSPKALIALGASMMVWLHGLAAVVPAVGITAAWLAYIVWKRLLPKGELGRSDS